VTAPSLERLLSEIPPDVLALCRRLRAAGHQAHLVGGGVRDMIAGRPPADFDLATDARPDAVVALFNTFAIPTGLKHGTVTVLTETRRPVEVTTFRGEGEYLDGRRPVSVTYVDSLTEDLSRRDFTMNAIAFEPLDRQLTVHAGSFARSAIRWSASARTGCARCAPCDRPRSWSSRSIRPRWPRSRRPSTFFARCRRSGSATSCTRCWRRLTPHGAWR
jgi:hypothetical protein